MSSGRDSNGRQRMQLRLPQGYRVFVEVLAPVACGTEDGELAVCRSLDISARGLALALERQVPVDAILQISVEPGAGIEPLYLTGEVRWCRPSELADLPWSAGFALLRAEGSDIDRWVALISDLAD